MIRHGLVDLDHVSLRQLDGCWFKWEFISNFIKELKNIINLVLIVFANLCCRSMARASVPLNFNAFLEKAKLKDDGSNYTDWVCNLTIMLIAAQKNYVLDALLGDRPAAGADADECLASSIWWLLNSSVCHALPLRTWTSQTFWTPRSIWDVPRAEVDISS